MSGDLLSDPTEILFRQVHPDFFDDGKVTSQAFVPTGNHAHKLSVDRGSKTDAAAAYHLFPKKSVGTWGVTVDECQPVVVYDDPNPPEFPENPAHAYGDFTTLGRKARKRQAQKLRRIANERGCLYSPS